MADPLATYQTGRRFSTIGRIEYELHTDIVRVKGHRRGVVSDVGVPLIDLRLETLSRYSFRGRAFKIFLFVTIVGLAFPLITWPIFKNYEGQFTVWYLGCAAISVAGLLGMLCIPSRFEMVQFKNHSGIPALGVLGSRSQYEALQEFVAAIQSQTASVIKKSQDGETQSHSRTSIVS